MLHTILVAAVAANVAAIDPATVKKLQSALQDVVDIKQKQYGTISKVCPKLLTTTQHGAL